MLVVFIPFLFITTVSSHGAVVYPPPRNAVDHLLSPWADGVPNPVPAVSNPSEGYWCPVPNGTSLSGANGQACFWFSNGCSHGCPACDGTTRGPGVHNHKVIMMIMIIVLLLMIMMMMIVLLMMMMMTG